MAAQVIINGLEFAQKSLEMHGKIPCSQLSRLRDHLCSDKGELDYSVQGSINAEGAPALKLQVRGLLNLTCQRCLEPMPFPLDCRVNYILVSSEDMLPAPEDESDDADCLVADPQMQVLQLVEDEVMLGLPLAPKHENADCAGLSAGVAVQQENPFRVLQGLKLK
jgi:uncharacterized protein